MIIGIPFALLVVTVIFGRRAEASAYSQIEGQPGAAAAALNSARQGWFVTPGIAVTKGPDLVHRVLGGPGIVLVAEGPGLAGGGAAGGQRKRAGRFVRTSRIHELVLGDGDGQVPLRKLQRTAGEGLPARAASGRG